MPLAELFPSLPWLPGTLAIAVVLAMFLAFALEVFTTEVTAMAGAVAMLALGLVTTDDMLAAFANPAPWTIAAMFIITGGLVRTGLLGMMIQSINRNAEAHPSRTLAAFGSATVFASAFINNTPVVVVLMPVAIQLAKRIGTTASKLLIPLSYLTILGGMCTLIGTSTNLVVDGVARRYGMEPFSLFEITPMALILATAGFVYLRFIGARLLPERESMAELLTNRRQMKFFTEVAVPEGSPVIGRKPLEVDIFSREGMRVIDVLRSDESLRRGLDGVVLEAGDRVVLRTGVNELLSLKDSRAIALVDRLSSRSTTTVEALITPGCRLVGRSLGKLRLRRRYGVYPLAVHRRNQNLGRQLDDVVVQIGDTLLLEGTEEDIQRLALDVDLVNIDTPSDLPYRRDRAPLVLGVLVAVVLLAAIGAAPIFALASAGVVAVLLTRCIDIEEAFSYIDGQLMALVISMLVVGRGLENSGAIAYAANGISPMLSTLPPWALLLAVFLMSSMLTEMVSNTAVGALMTPVAISLAAGLGIDPRPLVVTVMIAASASFATPIGYQTNTLVYGPGGYRFTDFVKVGLPLNIFIGVLTSFLVPFFWPL